MPTISSWFGVQSKKSGGQANAANEAPSCKDDASASSETDAGPQVVYGVANVNDTQAALKVDSVLPPIENKKMKVDSATALSENKVVLGAKLSRQWKYDQGGGFVDYHDQTNSLIDSAFNWSDPRASFPVRWSSSSTESETEMYFEVCWITMTERNIITGENIPIKCFHKEVRC